MEKRGLPLGIKVLTIYTALLGVFYLIFGLLINVSMLFGFVLEGLDSMLLNIAFLVVIIVVIHGFFNPNYFAWKMAVFWFSFEVINSFFSMIAAKGNIFSIISDTMTLGFLFIMFIDGLIIWYLFTKKKYFIAKVHRHELKYEDHVFMSVLLILIAIGTIFLLYKGVGIYHTTLDTSKEIVKNFDGKSFMEAVDYCDSLGDIEKDICYMSAVAVYETGDAIDTCNLIRINFYRFTCLQAGAR